jgi:FAD/FMN-containing dehydrogenase
MGGQTIAPGGIRVNMLPLRALKLNEKTDLLHVDAGALWADVIPYLDRHGRSVEVMQSDNSFTVGGSMRSTATDGSMAVLPSHRQSSPFT